MSKPRNPHVGGQQMPLFTPSSAWGVPPELPDLRRCPRIALDKETRDDGLAAKRGPGWRFRAGYTVGTSVAWDGANGPEGLYFPTRHPDTVNFDPEAVARWEADHVKAGVKLLYQNSNYDIGWGTVDGVPLPAESQVEDVMAMDVMCDEYQMTYNLDDICKRLGIPGKDMAALMEAGAAYGFHTVREVKRNLWRMPARFVGSYAQQDAVALLKAADILTERLAEQKLEGAYRLEMDLVPMIVEMMRRGIRVDVEAAERAKIECLKKRDEAFRELGEKLGSSVGMEEIGKNSWLTRTFDSQGIKYPLTDKGSPSFTAGTTGWMHKHPHWLPQLVVRADKLNNAAHKFLQSFIIDYAHRGRLHAQVNQLLGEDEDGTIRGARTFRFSYSDPALQQMPSRDEMLAAMTRGVFLPEEGEYWGRADYSQQEYRLIVHFAHALECTKAQEAMDKYNNNPDTDYHSMVAELTGLDRKPAKDTNFAKSYGAGIPKFASMINKSVEEAQAIMEQYDREMPFVKQLAEACQKLATRRGYIRLLDGARSHFDDWELAWREKGEPFSPPLHMPEFTGGTYNPDKWGGRNPHWRGRRLRRAFVKDGMNRLIQGSAARQTKLAMRACWRESIVPILQVHDELNGSFISEAQGAKMAQLMRDVVKLSVPMAVDTDYGTTWGDAKHKWKDVKRDAA